MTDELMEIGIQAAQMIARGDPDAEQLVVDRSVELFGADGGVGMTHWAVGPDGRPDVRLAAGGPPPPPGWLEQATAVAPRTASIVELARAGLSAPLRVSDVVDLPSFWATEEYAQTHGVNGGRYPMGAALLLRPDEFVFLGMQRTSRDFDDDEVEDLRRLQSLLASAYAFRRALDDAVSGISRPRVPRTAAVPWVSALLTEYMPTRREAEVLALVANGWTNRRIAKHLGITERTVRKHLGAVYEQAGVTGRAAAAAWWQGHAENRHP